MSNLRNWVKELCTTVGAGPLVLSGAATNYTTFVNAFGTAPTSLYYVVRDLNTQDKEAGIGTFDGASTITRDTPRDVLVQGNYVTGSPDPIYLNGNSEVFVAFTRGAFEDLLKVSDAAAQYVAKTAPTNIIGADTELRMYGPLISAYADQTLGAYAELSNAASVVTVGTLPRVGRSVQSVAAETNYTLQISDSGGVVYWGDAELTHTILYVPTTATVPFEIGQTVKVINSAFHNVTISPVSGVEILPPRGYQSLLPNQFGGIRPSAATAILTKYVGDRWTITGDLEPDP